MNNTLYLAKRAAEKAHRVLADYILSKYRDDTRGTVCGYLSGPLDDIRYCHPTAGNRKTFLKHAAAVEALKLNDATLDAYLACLVNAYDVLVNEAALEKKRLELKRAGVKAKADLNARLNLQPGVSLKGVDVGQYEVILAGLEPVRAHVELQHTDALVALKNKYTETLAAHNWNPELVKAWRVGNPEAYNYFKAPTHFNAFFKAGSRSGGRYGSPADNVCEKSRDEVEAYINKVAKLFALAYVQGYAAKLAVKTGEVIANDFAGFAPVLCWVTSNDLWRNSVAYIKLHDASKAEVVLTFHTQIIWNRSCLGKVFNQYPTRRV